MMLNTKYYLVQNEKGQYGVMRVWELFGIFRYVSFLNFASSRLHWQSESDYFFFNCWDSDRQKALESFKVVKNGYTIVEELS